MKKSIKKTKNSAVSKKTVTRKKTAAPRKKSAASKKSGSFMSNLKKMFFPTFLAMVSIFSMNADCGGCKAKPVRVVRVEKVKSSCGGCSARPVKVRANCGRVGCTARPVHVSQHAQTKKAMTQDLQDMKQAKVEHTNKLATLKKQGKVNSPEAANHKSIIQRLEIDISDLKDKIESLA